METCYGIAPVAILPHADIVAFMRRTPLVTVEPLAVTDISRGRREVRDRASAIAVPIDISPHLEPLQHARIRFSLNLGVSNPTVSTQK